MSIKTSRRIWAAIPLFMILCFIPFGWTMQGQAEEVTPPAALNKLLPEIEAEKGDPGEVILTLKFEFPLKLNPWGNPDSSDNISALTAVQLYLKDIGVGLDSTGNLKFVKSEIGKFSPYNKLIVTYLLPLPPEEPWQLGEGRYITKDENGDYHVSEPEGNKPSPLPEAPTSETPETITTEEQP